MNESTGKKTGEIWAVASGKGGTGKSFITSNMGQQLAMMGNEVVLVDADLGGANLHTFLGINRPRSSLLDFFEKKVPLCELVVETGVPDLWLVPGDFASLHSSDVKYTQKMKFFRHIKAIEKDFILMDLGAGAHFMTIDSFLLADKMIIVTLPVLIAIENMYHFIKNVVFRKLTKSLHTNGLSDLMKRTWKNREIHGIGNLIDLINHLKKESVEAKEILEREFSNFYIYLILNQVRSKNEMMIGSHLKSIFRKYFGFQTQYVGCVEYDEAVLRCTNRRQSFLKHYPLSRCAREIGNLTENLVQGRRMMLRGVDFV